MQQNEDFIDDSENSVVSVGNWLLSIIVTSIPIVNIIFLAYWAFNKNTNKTKSNWAKATLLLFVIIIALYAVMFGFAMLSQPDMPNMQMP